MPAPSDTATQNTPLAPSVEKAYYRKCIALKRRLNEVEAANDEARLRRVRLDRAIMKMRLERAFLLEELRRRMDANPEESDASGEEGLATPPTDRPHRDKRRRTTGGTAGGRMVVDGGEGEGGEKEGEGDAEEPLPLENPYAPGAVPATNGTGKSEGGEGKDGVGVNERRSGGTGTS